MNGTPRAGSEKPFTTAQGLSLDHPLTPASDAATSRTPPGIPKTSSLRTTTIIVVAIIVVAATVAGGYLWMYVAHRSTSSTANLDLVGVGLYYTIPAQQFDAVAFVTHQPSHVSGTLEDTWGMSIMYSMTSGELINFSKTGTVKGYSWTSGPIANHTTEVVNVSVSAGSWDFVILNPGTPGFYSITNETVIMFETALTLTAD